MYRDSSSENQYKFWMGQSAFVLDSYFVSNYWNQSISGKKTFTNIGITKWDIQQDTNGNLVFKYIR